MSNYRADVGVRKTRRGVGFTLEAFLNAGVGNQVRGEKLECDRPPETRIFATINHGHSALA